ncbi:MAG: hypothetical protein HDR80_08140 [Bacteroides sp.]|nr:hypothetical protein [Bacteroides sp.]
MDIVKFVRQKGSFELLPLGAGSVLAGTGAAVLRGNMEWPIAVMCLLFAVSCQLGFSYFFHYNQALRAQKSDQKPSILANSLDEYPVQTRVLSEASTACLLFSVMIGLVIALGSNTRLYALLAGVGVYGIVYLMILGPRLYRTPVSILFSFLTFGPVGVIGTCMVQAQHEAMTWAFYDMAPALFLSVAMGLLVMTSHWISGLEAYLASEGRIRNTAGRIGKKGVAALVITGGALAVGIIVWMTVALHIQRPFKCMLPFVFAFALNTFIGASIPGARIGKLRYLGTLSRFNFLLAGLLTLIFWAMIGAPDDSMKIILPL